MLTTSAIHFSVPIEMLRRFWSQALLLAGQFDIAERVIVEDPTCILIYFGFLLIIHN